MRTYQPRTAATINFLCVKVKIINIRSIYSLDGTKCSKTQSNIKISLLLEENLSLILLVILHTDKILKATTNFPKVVACITNNAQKREEEEEKKH